MIFTLLAFREMLKPLVYWHVWHIFETDISQRILQPYGKGEAEVKLYSADDGVEGLCKEISAMGELDCTEVKRRFTDGWLIAMAFVKGQPVGYMWLVLSSGMELAFDTYWIVKPGEALRYGSFVIPAFRGQGIHSILNHAVVCYLRGRNIRTALGSVSVLNPQSLSLPKHNRRKVAMTVLIVRIHWGNWTIRKSFGAPLEARFSWPAE